MLAISKTRTVRPRAEILVERPANSMDWAGRIDRGEAGPEEVIRDCKLSDKVIDGLLLRAYRQTTGGTPCGA